MAVKKLYVYDNNGEMRVHPSVIVLLNHVGGGQSGETDALVVVNATRERIIVNVSDVTHGDCLIDPGRSSDPFPATANIKAAHAFPVIGTTTNRRGVANSDPVVIIDT